MFTCTLNRSEFEGLVRELMERGHALRFRAHGGSMRPFIYNGDLVEIAPVQADTLRRGDVVLCSPAAGHLLLHRVRRIDRQEGDLRLLIQGDALRRPDGVIRPEQVLGRVRTVQHGAKTYHCHRPPYRWVAWLWAGFSPLIKAMITPGSVRISPETQ